MGFKIPKRTALLILHGDYEGGEVRATLDISMADYLILKRWRASEVEQDEEKALRFFADRFLISWNLESDDGALISCSGDGMMQIPLNLAVAILNAWQENMEGVPAPLATPSGDGLQLEAASMPLATELANPSS